MAKRDPDDVVREEGPDAFRAIYDARIAENERAREQPQPNGNGAHIREPERRFPLTRFSAIPFSLDEQTSIVHGFIPYGGVVVVWGPWKSGKTFWTFDLMMHVACGWSYRGRSVEQGTVVYMALEGGKGARWRAQAWRQQNPEHGDPPLYLIDRPVDLINDHKALVAEIRQDLGDIRPAIVTVDTLNRALVGDENQKDMARFIRAVDEVRVAFGCTVVLVHHCGHDDSRMRGHSALPSAIDAEIKISRDEVKNVVAKVLLMRDGEPGAEEVNRLETVTLGYNPRGDPITSCVVVPVGGAVRHERVKVSGVTGLVLRALEKVLAEGELPFSDATPTRTKPFCPVSIWRQQFYLHSADDPDTRQKQFVRAVRKLQELRIIEVSNDHVWLTGHAGHDRTK